MKVYQRIANLLQARENCEQSGNSEWHARHGQEIQRVARDFLPRGSGFDSGTTVDLDLLPVSSVPFRVGASTPEKIILDTSFHHMNSDGYYNGWTEHRCVVRPSLAHGFTLSVGGRDRRGIKEEIGDCLRAALDAEIPDTECRLWWPSTQESIEYRDLGGDETARTRAQRRLVLERARNPREVVLLQDRSVRGEEPGPWVDLGGMLSGDYVMEQTSKEARKAGAA